MTARASTGGFSFVEALVVLAITSALLVLLFSVSTGGARAGFRLAGRAGEAADRAVGADALRTLIRSVRLPERGGSPYPFAGDADGFTAAVAPGRPTPCGPAAPSAALRLQLDRSGGRTRVVCAGREGRGAVLVDLGPGPAAFGYALAGRPWSDSFSAELPPERRGAAPPSAPARARLWMRLVSADGRFEIMDAVDAPPPRPRTAGA